MSKYAKILNAWFTLWQATMHMLEIDLEPSEDAQFVLAALVAMSND